MNGVTVLTARVPAGGAASPAAGTPGAADLPAHSSWAALSPVAGRLSDRIGTRFLSTGGMIVIAAGLALLAAMPWRLGPGQVMIALAVVGLGMASFSAPNTSA